MRTPFPVEYGLKNRVIKLRPSQQIPECILIHISNLPCFYSLHSTATQNTWHRGLALGNAPNARIWRWGYQLVGILEPTQTLKLASPPTRNQICVFPDTKPQRQSVEYRWCWVFWRWPCIFHVYFMYISCIFHVHFMLFVHHFPRWLREN